MLGQSLTLWTIRISLALYALVVVRLLGRGANESPAPAWLRWAWLASCLLLLVHVALAFHFYHQWSHAKALEHTASETQRLLGWRFGYGIYFNHLFALLWTVDALWWVSSPASYERRSPRLRWVVHSYLFFIAFNGAVVFEDGPVRWAGVAATVLLLGLLLRRAGGAASIHPSTGIS